MDPPVGLRFVSWFWLVASRAAGIGRAQKKYGAPVTNLTPASWGSSLARGAASSWCLPTRPREVRDGACHTSHHGRIPDQVRAAGV